jgi:hypothetical protein
MQQAVKRVQVVIARRADMAQCRFQLLGILLRLFGDKRECGGLYQSVISIPS